VTSISPADVIANQYAFAQTFAGDANSALSSALSAATSGNLSFATSNINWALSTVGQPTTTDQSITAQYFAPSGNPGAFNSSSLQAIQPVSPLSLPSVYQINTTDLFKAPKPISTTNGFSTAAPSVNFDLIESQLRAIAAPNLASVIAPTLTIPTIGAMPGVTLPTFDVSVQADDPGVLSGVPEAFNAEFNAMAPVMREFIQSGVNAWYQSYAPDYKSALSALEAKLQDGLNNGTAMTLAYESALYARARSKTEADFNRGVNSIDNDTKRSGFFLPPSVINAGKSNLNIAAANANAVQSTEVAIKRAEQEIQYIQFVLTQTIAFRSTIMQTAAQYAATLAKTNDTILEAAKSVAGMIIDSYKANVAHYSAQFDLFTTMTNIYATQLKASMASLDVYRLQIEAAKLVVDVDQAQIQIYSEQVKAELTQVEIYTNLLRGIELQANIEKDKIEIYSEQVKAYLAQLSGDETRSKIYLAALQGDEALLKSEMAKLDASVKVIDANVSVNKSQIEVQKLTLESNQTMVDIYRAELGAYKTNADVSSTIFDGTLRGQIALIDAYKTNKQIELEVFKQNLDGQKLTLDKAEKQAELNAHLTMKGADLAIAQWSLAANISKDVGSIYGNMAGSAIAGMNTMVSQASSA
jgi:hypothetical protein